MEIKLRSTKCIINIVPISPIRGVLFFSNSQLDGIYQFSVFTGNYPLGLYLCVHDHCIMNKDVATTDATKTEF